MGAFFIFPQHRTDLDVTGVESHFARCGFSPPRKFTQAGVTVWIWPKQKHAVLRCIVEGGLCVAFAIGTMVYHGLGGEQSLRCIVRDWRLGKIDWDELIGSFCVGFWDDGKWRLLTDQLECQPIFVDQRTELASSSFLALLVALPGKKAINRLAFAEKVATGYIVGPDTLVEEIRKVTRSMQTAWKGRGWSFVSKPPNKLISNNCEYDRKQCLERQLACIETYFSNIRTLANEAPAVLGLSTGYDSRLLFAVACRAGFPVALQTHATAGVHDFDREVVSELAARKRATLVVVPTRKMPELSEENFATVLTDCVNFFDGRCSHNMGAFSETYTRRYSVASLGEFALRLNGLGGEIYRNYYSESTGEVNFNRWMDGHIYYPTARAVIANAELWEEMHRNKIAKMCAKLGVDLTAPADFLTRKRYYSEIRMPECDGANNNAHNQVAYYLTPFIDWRIIRAAYQAVPFIGLSGKFQAELIQMADSVVAAAPSHYGFSLTSEPVRHRIKSWLKCTVPDAFWVSRRERHLRTGSLGKTKLEKYRMMCRRYPALQQAEQAFRDCMPRYSWEEAQRHYAQGPTMVFLATWLMLYADKLSFD